MIKRNLTAAAAIVPLLLAASMPAHALFGDDEARKAILDLREKVEAAQNAQLMLQGQIDQLREQNAAMTGRLEELANQLAMEQRASRDLFGNLDKRLAELEPTDTDLDGRLVHVSAEEKRLYTGALAFFSQGKYAQSRAMLENLTAIYPQSAYRSAALFWLGNSQYADEDLKAALATVNTFLTDYPKDTRVPDALLTKAAAQVGLGQRANATKTLQTILKEHKDSSAAGVASDRLKSLTKKK